MAHARLFVGLAILILAQTAPAAVPSRIGQAVLLKNANTRILHTNAQGQVVPISLTHTHYYVREERDGCVRIRHQGIDGWLDLRDVLSPEEAVAFFTEQIRRDPTNARAYLLRGTAWDLSKDADKALADFNEAVRLDPMNPKAIVKRGWVWTDKKDYDRALKEIAESLRLDPKCVDAYYCRGYAHYQRDEYDESLEDFATALRLDPTDAWAAYYQGIVWAERGDLDRALVELDTALVLDPECADAAFERAVVRSKRHEWGRALRDYDTALRLDPTNAAAYCGRGGALIVCGDYDRALADLNEAVRLDPHEASGLANRGMVWFARGDYDKALKDYTEAVRLDPTDAKRLHDKAVLLAVCPDAKYRDGTAAVDLALKACELTDYRDGVKLRCLAAAYAEAGNFTKAVKWQMRALELAPPEHKAGALALLDLFQAGKPYRDTAGRLRVWPGLVGATVLVKPDHTRLVRSPDGPPDYVATLRHPAHVVLEQKGDWVKVRERDVEGWLKRVDILLSDEAVDYFSERLRTNPNDARAYRMRAAARIARDASDLALQDIGEAIRLAPDDTQGFLIRGCLHLAAVDLDAALKDFDEVLRLDPADTDAWEGRGSVHLLRGETDKGLADVSEAIRLDSTAATALVKKAFQLATHPEAKYRDGKTAVDLALKACELTEYLECKPLLALAAALAETGNFDEAVKWQTRACVLAAPAERQDCTSALALYKTGKPYREELPGSTRPPFGPWLLTPSADDKAAATEP